MIRISLGNVGSGKTASEVREMFVNKTNRKTYSNIVTKLKNQINIKPDMIIKKDIKNIKTNKMGKKENVYEYKLNLDYWKNIKEPINVTLDEAHSILNARRSMSKTNIIITDWLALIRRVLGQSESGMGELTFITQLPNRIDNIARDMAQQIRYHVCHYLKECKKCGFQWPEHSELPEPLWNCPRCSYQHFKKFNHVIEVFKFNNMKSYLSWDEFSLKTFYDHYFINDIEKYFKYYSTLQWDNLFSEFY